MMKTFIVKHNLLEVDRFVFPGCKSGVFYRPNQWPEIIIKKLEMAEIISKKLSISLIRGEVIFEDEITKLEIQAESANVIKRFYDEWTDEIQFLEIEECENCVEIDEEKNVEANEFFKESIKQGNLPLFKVNKLIKKIELGLDSLKKIHS